MVINEDGKLYHTHWPQGKTSTKGILLQWEVPKSRKEQLLLLHHSTLVGGHLGHDKLDYWWPTLSTKVSALIKVMAELILMNNIHWDWALIHQVQHYEQDGTIPRLGDMNFTAIASAITPACQGNLYPLQHHL